MRKILVTGGAGFIGRWLVLRLLERGDSVTVLDDFSNGSRRNIEDCVTRLDACVEGSVLNRQTLKELFTQKFDVCYHLAARINVQESIDTPQVTFDNDVMGTFYVLEEARRTKTKVIFMSTCMVYDRAQDAHGISEQHPTISRSPYAACKIAGEQLTLSYYHAYGLPTAVVRPFNTYGPYQKSSGEGGVVAIFIQKALKNEPVMIYGDGKQTRDLLYVEDCAEFLIAVGMRSEALGQIWNAGLGQDISVNDLARLINPNVPAQHVTHIHPQSEIAKLLCDYRKSRQYLGWQPRFSLEQGIARTRQWLQEGCRV